MRLQFLSRIAVAAMALAVSACGSDSSGAGRINVRLVDGPAAEFKHIMLNIERVEIGTNGGWRTLGTPHARVDLLSLVNGVSAELVLAEPIDAGHYTQMRLVLADAIDGRGNEIQLADGTIAPLVVPSGLQSGIKVNVNFDVEADATADVFVDLDAKRSIFVHSTGNSAKYILRPVISAVADAVTSISGILTDDSNPAVGLPLVEVTAQKIGADGKPVIVRSATTALDGSYRLDLLRMDGSTYYVVAQPIVGDKAYQAKASPGFTLGASSTAVTYSAAFAALTTPASIPASINVAPTDAEGDWISVACPLPAGESGPAQTFIVRMEPVVTAPDLTFSVGLLPEAPNYSAWMTRSRIDGFGDVTVRQSEPPSFAVSATLPVPITFSF